MVSSKHPCSPRVAGQILRICCSRVAPMGIGQSGGNDWWEQWEWPVAVVGMGWW